MSPDDKKNAVLGKPVNRVDGRAKVTGSAKYAAEFLPAGVKYGVVLQSTIARGTIEAIDDSAALKLPGVVAVVTHKNAPRLKVDKASFFDNELNLLQDNKIFYSRQNIGVVVANSYETAREAATLVKVTYKSEPCDVDMHKPGISLKEYAPPDNLAFGMTTDSKRGDPHAAFKSADVKIDHIYSTPREMHVPMEPHATTAMWEDDKRLTVWDATQGISNVQSRLAQIFGIAVNDVHVICKFTGGGFGCKGSVWSNTPLAVLAARVAKAPVCLAMQRSETFGPNGFRPHTTQQVQLGSDKSGKLSAILHTGRMEGSHFDEYVENFGLVARFMYDCPNIHTAHRLVKLDIGKPTFMRAPGEAPGMFALESALDELAGAAGVDPLQLRLMNYSEQDAEKKLPYSNKNLKQCYEVGAKKFGWDKRNAKPGATRDGNLLVGMGMASATYPVWAFPSSARAELTSNGHLTVQSGSQDLGTGMYTVMAQVAAETMGMPMTNVTADLGDTNMPAAGVSGGSTSATCVGTAVKSACDALLKQLMTLAGKDAQSPLSGLAADDLVAEEGALHSKSNARLSDTYVNIMKRNGKDKLEARSSAADASAAMKYSMHSFGAHFCEVKVDPDLGKVTISRWLAVIDAGKIFNAKTARSQIYGGIIMGVGMAMMEESIMDLRYGRTINADLAEYHVPVHADIPDLDVEFIEVPDYHANPLGGHGIGEIGITGVPAALANAIYNATGHRVRDLPITLDKLIV